MKADHILDALEKIDEKYVEELFFQEKQCQCGTVKKHRLRLYILIAAMFLLLTACAAKVASQVWEDGWFETFFTENGNEEAVEELNTNQLKLLEQGLVKIGERVECNGYTITLESALSDGYRAFAKFVIEAPKGTVLNARRYYLNLDYNIYHHDGQRAKLPVSATSVSFLEDDDPTDNRVTMLMETLLQAGEESEQLLEKGMLWSIKLFDFGIMHRESPYLEQLVTIDRTLNVTFDEYNLLEKEREVLSKPIRCAGQRSLWQWDFPVRVKITSFRLRAMSATLTYQEPLLGYWEGITLGKTYLILTDGTKVEAHFSMMGNHGDYAQESLLLPYPIAIEDVEYVEFPGGKKVYLTE